MKDFTFKYTLAKTDKELADMKATVIASGISFRDGLQNLLVSTLALICKDGSHRIELVNDLIDQLKTTATAGHVKKYMEKFGGFIQTEGSEGFDDWQGLDYCKSMFGAAKETPWYASIKSAFKADDLEAAILRAINKVMKDEKKAQKLLKEGQEVDVPDMSLSSGTVQKIINMARFDHLVIHSDRVEVLTASNEAPTATAVAA